METTTTTMRAEGMVRGDRAVVTIGYPQADGRLRFGFEAEITVYENGAFGVEGPEVKVGFAAIQAQEPAEARLRAEVYMVAVEIAEGVLRVLTNGATIVEAFKAAVAMTPIEWDVAGL